MSDQSSMAINHKGWHVAACERHGDDDPANEGCTGNCPRRLHAEIDRLTRENASLRAVLTDLLENGRTVRRAATAENGSQEAPK